MPDHLGHPGRLGPGGNIPVYFEVLSYAGTLTLTAIADPDHFPELGTLTERHALSRLAGCTARCVKGQFAPC